MNIAYYYEFRGLDNVLNRVEILTNNSVTAKEVTGTGTPFVLTYSDAKKLDPVQGAGATIGLVSHEVFEFVSLHTDDMQGYMIKMYRAGKLYWVGWLDPELYEEQLSDYPPYPVEFTAADFNVLERLKYKDENDANYTDIVSMKEHLKRCLSALALPFEKIYIGCSTTAEGITLSDSETVLDKLYVMSANFYDEENEPMSCREVIECILRPFGLMMVQRDSNIYIYDYNTIEDGLPMKCYNYANWMYEGLQTPEYNREDLSDIGFMSTEGSYGFEEMKNNVTITSSIYAEQSLIDETVQETGLEGKVASLDKDSYTEEHYSKCAGWNYNDFILLKSKKKESAILGANLAYTGKENISNNVWFQNNSGLIIPSTKFFLRLKCRAYINTKNDPFDNDEKVDTPEESMRMQLFYKLILIRDGKNIMCYNGKNWEYVPESGAIKYGEMIFLNNGNWRDSRVLNQWLTNSEVYWTGLAQPVTIIDKEKDFQSGVKIPIPPESGILKLVISYAIIDANSRIPSVLKEVKNLIIDNVVLELEDLDGNSVSTDDYEFKSYVNKKVKSDLDEIKLKCISANEEKAPIGKANILKKVDSGFTFQLSYTRAGQTNILERLLMCTIHSNYSQKHGQFGCKLHLKGNPIMGYVTYNKFLKGNFLVTGAELNFRRATMTLSCVGFSKDVAKLSDIPYD